MDNPQQGRVIALIAYLIALALLHFTVIDPGFHLDANEIWLANGIASLLFGSRLLNPHFTPPADAATNGFVAGLTMITAIAAIPDGESSRVAVIALTTSWAICALSLFVILVRRSNGLEDRPWVLGFDKTVRAIGAPDIIFTFVLLSAVWQFHRTDPLEVFAILGAWTVIVALRPIEGVIGFFEWMVQNALRVSKEVVGEIAAYQNPGLVLIRQHDDKHLATGTMLLIGDPQGPPQLGVAINYVGRDEGRLLRTLALKLPPSLKKAAKRAGEVEGAARLFNPNEDEREDVKSVVARIGALRGIVDSGSDLTRLEFEVVNEAGLEEGKLIDVKIGEAPPVLYQIIDGVTQEELVQQKNKYGYAKAKARKIGRWDKEKEQFEPVSWLPEMNAPVFLKETGEFEPRASAIGHFPGTDYFVSINPSEAVTHNTAILGILGIGKSFLAIELVERMIADGIKVICLDLTNQYAEELKEFVNADREQALDDVLAKAGEGRPPGKSKEEGGSLHAFENAVLAQIREFLSADCGFPLRIINPSSFVVSKQTSGWGKDSAGFADLSPSEITAIISDCALRACQELGMTKSGRACLVYEEAHSLVPEWNSVASDGDKHATARSARAILQGRKYGLGCLLITQRTANVTKSILNQCNSIFAMRTFDDTGREFLGNYIGKEYAGVLPSLKERHAVFFGKASSCDDPVLIRLNDRDKFEAAFRAEHAPGELPEFQTVEELLGGERADGDNNKPEPDGPKIRTP
ncbi:ATP-binding protein [Hyphobacterium sp.]|uniref:ATP-binding protein n=1 Tax=Hyphobacterium sp. TaxID=2004662 RepID=UPI003BABA53F